MSRVRVNLLFLFLPSDRRTDPEREVAEASVELSYARQKSFSGEKIPPQPVIWPASREGKTEKKNQVHASPLISFLCFQFALQERQTTKHHFNRMKVCTANGSGILSFNSICKRCNIRTHFFFRPLPLSLVDIFTYLTVHSFGFIEFGEARIQVAQVEVTSQALVFEGKGLVVIFDRRVEISSLFFQTAHVIE